MKYFSTKDNEQTWYFEVDEDGVAYRQILVDADNRAITSNIRHTDHHFFLAEQPVEYKLSRYIQIEKELFEKVWCESTSNYSFKWDQTKSLVTIGSVVEGIIEVFYPQGVIIDLPAFQAIGIVSNIEKDSYKEIENTYPGYHIRAIVKKYDDVNMWIVLDNVVLIRS